MFLELTTGAILIITEIRPVVYPSGKPTRGGQADHAVSPALVRPWRVAPASGGTIPL